MVLLVLLLKACQSKEQNFHFTDSIDTIVKNLVITEELLAETEYDDIKHFYWKNDVLTINRINVARIYDKVLVKLKIEDYIGLDSIRFNNLIDNLFYLDSQNISSGHLMYGTKKGIFDHSTKTTNHPNDILELTVSFEGFDENLFYGYEVLRYEKSLYLLKIKEMPEPN